MRRLLVSRPELRKALSLIRDLRHIAVSQNISPVTVRISLKYALAIDDLASKEYLTVEEDQEIDLYVKNVLMKSGGKI